EARRVENAFMLPPGQFSEAREAYARVKNDRSRKGVSVIVAETVVLTGDKETCRTEAAGHARPVHARLPPVIMSVAEEEFLLIAQRLVETVILRVEVVIARLPADKVIPSL